MNPGFFQFGEGIVTQKDFGYQETPSDASGAATGRSHQPVNTYYLPILNNFLQIVPKN
jgi:hypothetical protein